MLTRTVCTDCGHLLTISDESLGQQVRCPQCGGTFTALAEEEPPYVLPGSEPASATSIQAVPPAPAAAEERITLQPDRSSPTPPPTGRPASGRDDAERFRLRWQRHAPHRKLSALLLVLVVLGVGLFLLAFSD